MKTSHSLNIGLDYHGVIDQNIQYFASFCCEATTRGHHIYIITGGPMIKIKSILRQNNIAYDFIFAVSDYYQALGLAEQGDDGSLEVPPKLWNIAKGEFCRRSHINIHIDDSPEYQPWFSTPFCLYNRNRHKCYYHDLNCQFDFSQPPSTVLNHIEKIFQ